MTDKSKNDDYLHNGQNKQYYSTDDNQTRRQNPTTEEKSHILVTNLFNNKSLVYGLQLQLAPSMECTSQMQGCITLIPFNRWVLRQPNNAN